MNRFYKILLANSIKNSMNKTIIKDKHQDILDSYDAYRRQQDLENNLYDIFVDSYLDYNLLKSLEFDRYILKKSNNFIKKLANSICNNKTLCRMYDIDVNDSNIRNNITKALISLFNNDSFSYNDKYLEMCNKVKIEIEMKEKERFKKYNSNFNSSDISETYSQDIDVDPSTFYSTSISDKFKF